MSESSHCQCHTKESHDHSSHDKVDIRETSPPAIIAMPVYTMSVGAASTSVYYAAA